MINYKLLKEHGLEPKKIKKAKKSTIIETKDEKKYVLKDYNPDIAKKFNYLLSRNFTFFPTSFPLAKYNVYEYIENSSISSEERLYDIVDLISLLHTKTTRYKNVDIDDYKIIYEDIGKELADLTNYYTNLNDLIDNEVYMSPSKYLLARNISKVYSSLYFCKEELENWYDLVKNSTKTRVSYIHNNLELSHLLRNDTPYLISWEKSKVDLPIYDLYDLYKKYYKLTDFGVLLNNYQKRYPLKEEELKLFFIKISIPFKLEFLDDEFHNTKKVKELLEYLECGDSLIRPYYVKVKND